MKKMFLTVLAVLGFALAGCQDTTTNYVTVDKDPAAPQGVYSITGDLAVYVYWLPVQESDLAGYRVYRSFNDTIFDQIGSTVNTQFTDNNVTNGVTYFYAVTAYDVKGHESVLSRETVFDTPRPEGALILYDANNYPGISGYDFSADAVVAWWDTSKADIYVDFDTATSIFYIDAATVMTDIQDMGYASSFSDIGYSPNAGWSKLGYMELVTGHIYIVWTKDNHYAKLWVKNISSPTNVRFDWAYQTAAGNPELARPVHGPDYLRIPVNTKQLTIVK